MALSTRIIDAGLRFTWDKEGPACGSPHLELRFDLACGLIRVQPEKGKDPAASQGPPR